jgi:NAD(P)-dependent dehydrogenase (short-subunit alcohol dehydrogenase family)
MSTAAARGTVAVLGGTRGLGRRLAVEGLRRGHDVVAYGRSAAPAAAQEERLRTRVLDLTDPAAVDSADLDELRGPGPLLLFWVAGAFLKRPLAETAPADIDRLTALLWQGPVHLLRRLLADTPQQPSPGRPLHLVTVASSSSWRARDEQSLYCGLKAAQSAFTRGLASELLRADPRNRVTLIQPGAMATPGFHDDLGLEPGELDAFMDPAEVAAAIWQLVDRPAHAEGSDQRFLEAQLLRGGTDPVTGRAVPRLLLGPQAPEPPVLPVLPEARVLPESRVLPEAARL